MADEIIALRPRTLGFLGDGAEIDEIIILFAVHDYLHSLSIAAECSIMKASEALPDQRRDKAPDMGALSGDPLGQSRTARRRGFIIIAESI